MREYGQVQCAFWQSDDALNTSDAGKLLAVYLLTGPHSNGIGCYRCPDGYVMADLGWSAERVSEGFAELSRNGFAYRFDGVVFLPNFLRWNRVANGNVATARLAEFDALPKGEAKARTAASILKHVKHLSNEARTVLQTVAETVSETVSETVRGTVCQPEPNPTQREPREEKKLLASSAEPTPPAALIPAEPPVATFLLNDGSEFPISRDEAREFADLYPAVDVPQELRAVKAWCKANPKNRKTRGGALRFVNSWLARAQNNARASGNSQANGAKPNPLPRLQA